MMPVNRTGVATDFRLSWWQKAIQKSVYSFITYFLLTNEYVVQYFKCQSSNSAVTRKGSRRRYCLVKGIRPLLGQKNKIRVPSTIRAVPCVTEGDTVGSSFSRWTHPSPASFSADNSYSQLYLLRNPKPPLIGSALLAVTQGVYLHQSEPFHPSPFYPSSCLMLQQGRPL